MEKTKTFKVVLHELPGGAEAFELITKFSYNNGGGGIQLTPNNTCLLHFAAHFMEMDKLAKETEKSLEGISYWMWSEVINALKQCQDFFSAASSSGVLNKLLDSLVRRIATLFDSSPSGSSPESSGFRFSFDTKSTLSTKINYCRSWWFEDVACLNSQIIEKVIKRMIMQKLDNGAISRFLFYYLKVRLINSTPEEKRKITETIIDLLYSLDQSSFPCKNLFGILRLFPSSQNLISASRSRLESMIGVQIDRVVLDNLLVLAPPGMECLYDVDLILRFMQFFLDSEGRLEIARLKKVGGLMDLYLAEVAPDSGLKPLKFVELVTALPDAARDSHDALYRAIDIYLEVHTRLSEEDKMKICCAINYEKLSSESCKHLAQNSKFPSRTAILALISQHSKLKSLLKDTNNLRLSGILKQTDNNEQIILYAKRLDLSAENKKLLNNLQGMQWRVMELEKVCRKMQSQMTKMRKKTTTTPHRSSSKSLPRMCS